jgi:hypothetical protein
MKKAKFPQFDSYACVGDKIEWTSDGFDFVATLESDTDSNISDYGCYGPVKIKQWKHDEWFFVGVVVSVSTNGVLLSDHAASLWGIECNYNKKANKYLATVARELQSKALETAKTEKAHILSALQS